MSNSIHLISLLLLASGLSVHAQEKRAMTFDEMVGWERISEQRISDNGKWVFCKMEPWRGDATIQRLFQLCNRRCLVARFQIIARQEPQRVNL